jgi:hypothetical protein
MRDKALAIMVTFVLALLLSSCNKQTTNENMNANAATANTNMNANSAPANANANENANTTSRRAPTREEYERDKERYKREAKESGRTIGQGVNDGWLWVKTRFDLAAADDLRDSTINVDVDNGVVTLSGTVATAAQKAKADSVAKSVEGVKSVKDMLKVSAGNTGTASKNANQKPVGTARK